jgi:two-component sensor histidine kinase
MFDPRTTSGTRGGTPPSLGTEERVLRAVEACGIPLWEWRVGGHLLLLTPCARELLGLPDSTVSVSLRRFLALVHGEDVAGLRRAVEDAFRGEDDFVHEFRIRTEDTKAIRWISIRARVVERGVDGEVLLITGSGSDVTKLKHEQEAREILSQELAHRMKNVLSIVGSLVALSGGHRPEAREFVTSFQARLGSLAATHELLIQADWQPIALGQLVKKVLAPLGVLDRIDITGNQAFLLGSHDAQTLALVLHELATNAIKYGGLSNGAGRVALGFEVTWERRLDEHPLLVLRWQEAGGPAVAPPSAKGFGLTLLERLSRRHEQAEQVLEWRLAGLLCCVSLRVVPLRLGR